LCAHETQRPVEALEKLQTSESTHRPASPWRWLKVHLITLLAPLMWLAHLGAREVSVRAQDERLRERARRRGRQPLWEMSRWWRGAQELGNGLPEALSWRLWGRGGEAIRPPPSTELPYHAPPRRKASFRGRYCRRWC
jgi:hypothetical protein